jgi:hypothetical protein
MTRAAAHRQFSRRTPLTDLRTGAGEGSQCLSFGEKPLSHTSFSRRLKEHGYKKQHSNVVWWISKRRNLRRRFRRPRSWFFENLGNV